MDQNFSPGRYDVVNLLCVVEHLLGSPKCLMKRIKSMLEPEGVLLFCVPNQARLLRRMAFFFGGISVHPDYGDYFHSEYPFSGHNREYTYKEVIYALNEAGFRINELGSIKYPPNGSPVKRIVGSIANLLPSSFHQLIFVSAKVESADEPAMMNEGAS